MNILTILPLLKRTWTFLKKHKKIAVEAFLVLSVALSLAWGINLHKQNKKLSESLEMAQNNVEAYLGALNGSLLAFNVLKLDMRDLSKQNDSLLVELDKIRKEKKIKAKELTTAATQTLIIDVNGSKGVKGDIITILKDTVYTDTMLYNNLTKVYYSIGTDSVKIALDILNTQYLYIFHHREYKNLKNFIKRLLTLDFKKVTKYKYDIHNTNELVNTKDVRIVESIDK